MKINVGSLNKTKISAVFDAVQLYPDLFPSPEIKGVEVNIELFGHPKNLKESVKGAMDRAEQAYNDCEDCEYSFGLEGGLIEVPLSKSGYMEVGVCAVYNRKDFYLGLSPAFEWPSQVTNLILTGKADASKAFKQLGFTEHSKLGAVDGGIIGMLTRGKLTREQFTKYSIIMALVQLENAGYYGL